MKLLRYGEKGDAKPGVLHDDGTIRDISGAIGELRGGSVSNRSLNALREIDISQLPVVEGQPRLAPCLADVPNFHCVGLNYAKHAEESGMEKPTEPVLFSKATSCISGPYDDIVVPRDSTRLDWEVELGVVIGRPCSYVREARALDFVAGYCVINDVSERAFQIERGGQWVKGKSAPTFGPIGPWLVTADEVPDPQNLRLGLSVNGESMQDSTTADMIFSVAEIISYMSRFMQLRPGDIIATGTPEGVGMGMKPQRWLQPGDVVQLGVEGLGEQRQTVVAAR